MVNELRQILGFAKSLNFTCWQARFAENMR